MDAVETDLCGAVYGTRLAIDALRRQGGGAIVNISSQRADYGAPSRLLELEEVAAAVLRLVKDDSMAGRVLVWWSENLPGLIERADRDYGPF